MTLREDTYQYKLLGPTGATFLRSIRPKTLSEITADPELMRLLRRYRHTAWTADGQEIASLPDIDHPAQ